MTTARCVLGVRCLRLGPGFRWSRFCALRCSVWCVRAASPAAPVPAGPLSSSFQARTASPPPSRVPAEKSFRSRAGRPRTSRGKPPLSAVCWDRHIPETSSVAGVIKRLSPVKCCVPFTFKLIFALSPLLSLPLPSRNCGNSS